MKKKTFVEINLDKKRKLHYDLNALEMFEEITGLTIDKIGERMSMKVLKALVFAGLSHEDEELTLKDVGSMISIEDLPELTEAIGKAFQGLN